MIELADRLSTLPRYARDEISRLEQLVARLTEQAEAGSDPESDTFIEHRGVLGSKQGIGQGVKVRFGPEDFQTAIRVRREPDGSVYVAADGGLTINPRSGNVIILRSNR